MSPTADRASSGTRLATVGVAEFHSHQSGIYSQWRAAHTFTPGLDSNPALVLLNFSLTRPPTAHWVKSATRRPSAVVQITHLSASATSDVLRLLHRVGPWQTLAGVLVVLEELLDRTGFPTVAHRLSRARYVRRNPYAPSPIHPAILQQPTRHAAAEAHMPHPSAFPLPLHRAVRLEKASEHRVQLEVGEMQQVQFKSIAGLPASTLDLTLHPCPRPNLTVNPLPPDYEQRSSVPTRIFRVRPAHKLKYTFCLAVSRAIEPTARVGWDVEGE
ncbi:hypothetical protein B0H10DRAFT_1958269 [Mycena sp. CBHHK59/15]|nr:hypothetical protein B0H10DRAFT_1958269 [Mycena sp. CBHHK59/15]